jgi:hypothetical protein
MRLMEAFLSSKNIRPILVDCAEHGFLYVMIVTKDQDTDKRP